MLTIAERFSEPWGNVTAIKPVVLSVGDFKTLIHIVGCETLEEGLMGSEFAALGATDPLDGMDKIEGFTAFVVVGGPCPCGEETSRDCTGAGAL